MDVTNKLKEGGITNPYVIEYVSYWSGITEPDNIEVISAADDDRLIEEGLRSGEIFPAGKDLYYSRSYYKDTARSEERTVVATASESDKGV